MEIEEEPKKIMKIKDSSHTEFILDMKIIDENIHFKIKEDKVYSPFTFEGDYNLEDFREKHKAFKSCKDLEEVLRHLYQLYDNKKVKLYILSSEKCRDLLFTVWDISKEDDTKEFTLVQKMTEEKDKSLMDLYNIQKKQIEILKAVKDMVEKNLTEENPLTKNIKKILEKSQIKI